MGNFFMCAVVHYRNVYSKCIKYIFLYICVKQFDAVEPGIYASDASNGTSINNSAIFNQKNWEKECIYCRFVLFWNANYVQTECQFRYCGTAIPFLTVRSTAR